MQHESASAQPKRISAPTLSAEIPTIPLEAGRYIIYAPLRRAAFVTNASVVNFLADLQAGSFDDSVDPDGRKLAASIPFVRSAAVAMAFSKSYPTTGQLATQPRSDVMKLRRKVQLAIGLLSVFLVANLAAAGSTTPPNLKPVYLDNNSYEVVTVKVIGPTKRTLKLGLTGKQMILLAPGNYRCFYGFYGDSPRPETFMKTRDFSVSPSLIATKPLTISINNTENLKPDEESSDPNQPATIRSVLPSSAPEFNEADRGGQQPAQAIQTEAGDNPDSDLRFSEIDIVATIGELYYPEAEAQKRRARAAATRYLSQLISGFLLPKLARQGFRVKYLGVRDEPGPTGKATLSISYEESEGDAYSMFGIGDTEAHGVVITCSLSLVHPALGESAIWQEELTGDNPSEIKVNILASNYEAILYQNALRHLRNEFSALRIDVSDWASRTRAASATAGAATTPARRTRLRATRPN